MMKSKIGPENMNEIKGDNKIKGDDRRNMYGNIAKSAIRAYDSKKYAHLVSKIHEKMGITEST